MSVWRDMVIDGGLHIDTGWSIDEAAAWVEAQAYAEWEKYQARQEVVMDEAQVREGAEPGGDQ